MSKMLAGLVALVLLASLAACTHEATSAAPAAGGAATAVALNTVCPIGGDPVDPKLTRELGGATIGFCCEKCVTKFDAMDAAGKAAILAKVKG